MIMTNEEKLQLKRLLTEKLRPAVDVSLQKEMIPHINALAEKALATSISSFDLKMQMHFLYHEFTGQDPVKEAFDPDGVKRMKAFITILTIFEQCVIQSLEG